MVVPFLFKRLLSSLTKDGHNVKWHIVLVLLGIIFSFFLLWSIGGGRCFEAVVRNVKVFVQLKAGCDDSDHHLIVEGVIEGNTEDEVDVRMRTGTDHIGSQVDLVQTDIRWSGNIEDDALCTVDRGLEQWRGDRSLGSDFCLVLAAGTSNTHVSRTCAAHDLADVLKVKVNQTWSIDQVGDALYAVFEDVIRLGKGIEQRDLGLRYKAQTLVLDNNQRIDILFEGSDAAFCLFHSLFAFKFKRFGDDTNRQNVHLFCDLCNNRSCTSAGTAAHTGCDKDHLTTFDGCCNLVAAFFSSFLASFRHAACAASSGQTVANDDLLTCLGVLQRLCIGVDGDKFHTWHSAFDHAVDSVSAAAANTDPQTGELLFDTDHMLMPEDAAVLEAHGINRVYIRSVLTCEARSGVCAKCYGINLAIGRPVNAGEAVGVIAAQSIGEPGTQLTMRTFHTGGVAGDDITQGLPRVEELFEARKPKKMAVLSEISGTVTIDEAKKGVMYSLTVTNEAEGETVVYTVPHSAGILVHNGDHVDKGQELTSGALNPHDVLRIRGVNDDEFGRQGVRSYITSEVQKVYRQQGVDINDKHIEVIVRQMMRKVRVEEAGSTDLLSGATVDISAVKEANHQIDLRIAAGEEGLSHATYTQLLMGITKASLATESFLSAASFQETTKVLTDAAIKGKVDHLVGLKENVIIGKLIPAGTGLSMYRDFEEHTDETIAESAEEYVDLSALVSKTNAL